MKGSVLQLTLILFLLLQLPTINLKAQEISGIEIYPENITNSDEVMMIITTSFPLTDCYLDSVNIFYACGAFSFDGFYSTGFNTGECERTDTMSLGVLANGPYLISYRMYYLGWAQVDQVDTFIVVGTTGIEHLSNRDAALSIWPNPSPGRVNIGTDNRIFDRLTLSNIHGSFTKNIQLNNQLPNSINTISLPAGMYICTAFRNDQPISIKKFIVLD